MPKLNREIKKIPIFFISFWIVTAFPVAAQENQENTNSYKSDVLQKRYSESMPAPQNRRDPFSASRNLKNRKNIGLSRSTSNLTLEPSAAPAKMPKMRLKGHLQAVNGEIVALLEIEKGGIYIVREGDTVGLHDFGFDAVIQIKKINRRHLIVESGSLGQLIIVR